MKLLVVFLLALAQIGCGQLFTTVKATILAHNTSNRNMVVVIDTKQVPIAPNSQFEFTISIDIATPRDIGMNSPSPVDQQTQITVRWFDAWTNLSTDVRTCNAGAKIKTVVVYNNTGNFQNHKCEYITSY